MAERNRSRILVMWLLVGFVALCVATVLIASRGNLSTLRLNKEQADFWDSFFKGVGGVVGIVGGSVALSKLLDERVKENHTDALKAREPFFNKRQEVYSALVTATANICTHEIDTDGRKAADEQFWTIFWGPLPMIIDDDVGGAVNSFHILLTDEKTKRNNELLRNASMDLARTCRKSLGFDVFVQPSNDDEARGTQARSAHA